MNDFATGDMICPKKGFRCVTWDYLYPKQEVGRIFQHQIALVIGNIKEYNKHGEIVFDDVVVFVNDGVYRLSNRYLQKVRTSQRATKK